AGGGVDPAPAQTAVARAEDDPRRLRGVRRVAGQEVHAVRQGRARLLVVLEQVVEAQRQGRVARDIGDRQGRGAVVVLRQERAQLPGRAVQDPGGLGRTV